MKGRTKPRTSLNITGAAMRRIRMAANPRISQEDMVGRLARLGIMVDQSTVAKMEAGKRWMKDFEVAAVAKALRVPVQALYEG